MFTVDISSNQSLDSIPQENEILESLPYAFYVVDAEWRIIYANKRMEDLTRCSQNNLIGANLWDVFPIYKQTVGFPAHQHAMRDRVPVQFETFYAGSGTWVEANIYPSPNGDLFVYVQDVTYRKHLEQALKEADRRYRELMRFRLAIENLLDAFTICSAIRNDEGKIIDFRLEYANEAACRFAGKEPDDTIGRTVLELNPGLIQSEFWSWFVMATETGLQVSSEDRPLSTKAGFRGKMNYYDLRVSKLGDGFTMAWRDVTARRQTHEAMCDSVRRERKRANELQALVERITPHRPEYEQVEVRMDHELDRIGQEIKNDIDKLHSLLHELHPPA